MQVFNDVKELRLYAEELVNQYPVVLSTTFSARTAVPDMVYDYLIMDEASQVSIETGALALTCAKNAVIVGDTLQLPNVVTDEDKLKLDSIFKEYKVMEGYNCSYAKHQANLAQRALPLSSKNHQLLQSAFLWWEPVDYDRR